MKIPARLKECSIVDSICEIRFESTFPSEIVTGMIFGALSSVGITEIEGLPASQLPEAIRNIDEQLKYAPHYKANIGKMTLQFGGGMVAISSPIPYIGWEKFRPEIETILKQLIDQKLIKKIVRISRRTINFFKIDILEHSHFQVKTPIEYQKKQYNYTDYYCDNDLIIRTTIANQATYESLKGSVIDIDAYVEYDNGLNIADIMELVDKTHVESKKVFFKLLQADFIESMGPEYD